MAGEKADFFRDVESIGLTTPIDFAEVTGDPAISWVRRSGSEAFCATAPTSAGNAIPNTPTTSLAIA